MRTGGPLEMDEAVDFVRTTRGVTWGVKVTDTGDWAFVMVFVRNEQGQWISDGSAEAVIDQDFNRVIAAQFKGDVQAWMQAVCIPRLNAWLAVKFPPGAEAPKTTTAEQADLAIRALRVLTRPDGTVFVSQS